jgi:hypothetical protein
MANTCDDGKTLAIVNVKVEERTGFATRLIHNEIVECVVLRSQDISMAQAY